MLRPLAIVLFTVATSAQAQDAEDRLTRGWYVATLGSVTQVDPSRGTDDGYMALVAGGYRAGNTAFELAGIYGSLAAGQGTQDVDIVGGNVTALLFPLSIVPDMYVAIGAGALQVDNHPGGASSYTASILDGGLGYLYKMQLSGFDLGIRAEGRMRYDSHSEDGSPNQPVSRSFNDAIINIGLQIPLGGRPVSASAKSGPESAVEVVPVQQPVEQQPVEEQPIEEQPIEEQPAEQQPVEQPPGA